MRGLVDYVARYSTDRLAGEARRLANCEGMIPALAEARLAGARALLERELTRIPVLVSARISRSMTSLDNYASPFEGFGSASMLSQRRAPFGTAEQVFSGCRRGLETKCRSR